MSNTKNGRVNRFIFNSDYLTLAQANSQSLLIMTDAFDMAAGAEARMVSKDIALSAPKGAIARTLVTFQGTDSSTAHTQASANIFEIDELWDLGVRIIITPVRKDANTVTIEEYVIRYWYDEAVTIPSIAFTLTEKFFYPPNA